MKKDFNIIENLKNTMMYWEKQCDAGRAQSIDCMSSLKNMERLFEESGYEMCAHNAAILGSKRYEKYKIEGINFMLTKKEYKKYMETIENEKEYDMSTL
jgi:hypothetical protein